MKLHLIGMEKNVQNVLMIDQFLIELELRNVKLVQIFMELQNLITMKVQAFANLVHSLRRMVYLVWYGMALLVFAQGVLNIRMVLVGAELLTNR